MKPAKNGSCRSEVSRFQRTHTRAQLDQLTTTPAAQAHPGLLDTLPQLPGRLAELESSDNGMPIRDSRASCLLDMLRLDEAFPGFQDALAFAEDYRDVFRVIIIS